MNIAYHIEYEENDSKDMKTLPILHQYLIMESTGFSQYAQDFFASVQCKNEVYCSTNPDNPKLDLH